MTKPSKRRLFIAAQLPEELVDCLEDNQTELAETVPGRCTPVGNFHVTLAFLGSVEEERVEQAAEAMARACEGVSVIDAELGDYGTFGAQEKCVLWQGIETEGRLEELQTRMADELRGAGFELEDREFAAHVTLMRGADMRGQEPESPYVEEGEIGLISLFESDLSGDAPVYTPLRTIELQPKFQHGEGRIVFVDADACPVIKESLAEARRSKVGVIVAGNSTQNLERHIRPDDPSEPNGGYWADTLPTSVGADSADFAIMERVREGDIVVTQDIGLAAMVLGRGAAAIGVRGKIWTSANIDLAMEMRHVEKKVRRQGGRTAGPSAFTDEDRSRFTAHLRRLLSQ